MSHNNSSPRHDNGYTPSTSYSSPPIAPRSTKPGYNSQNAFMSVTPNYISSPFDDEPLSPPSAAAQHSHPYEKDSYNQPYNPDFVPTSNQRSNSYSNNQSAQHSTLEHNLSPIASEKTLTSANAMDMDGRGGQTYAMQHLGSPRQAYNSPYDNHNNNSGNYNTNNNQYYQNQHGNNYNRDSYYQDEPQYYNGYDEERPSLSNDTAPMRPHSERETSDGLTRSKSGITNVKYRKEKSKYLRCFPCIRSTCGRFTCCFCLIFFLIVIVLAIVIVTVFKLPVVDYLGLQSDPVFSINQGDTTFGVTLVANIKVNNPNPMGFKFESIAATAYYPGYAPALGGGNITNQDFPSKTTKTIQFPITASYNRQKDPGLVVVRDILDKCALLGSGVLRQLTINYDLKLTTKFIGITISPTIKNQHVNLDCPPNIRDIANDIPGGISSLIGGGGA